MVKPFMVLRQNYGHICDLLGMVDNGTSKLPQAYLQIYRINILSFQLPILEIPIGFSTAISSVLASRILFNLRAAAMDDSHIHIGTLPSWGVMLTWNTDYKLKDQDLSTSRHSRLHPGISKTMIYGCDTPIVRNAVWNPAHDHSFLCLSIKGHGIERTRTSEIRKPHSPRISRRISRRWDRLEVIRTVAIGVSEESRVIQSWRWNSLRARYRPWEWFTRLTGRQRKLSLKIVWL